MRAIPLDASAPMSVLAIGAHPDDIEIGCAGTLMKLIGVGAVADVHWIVLTGQGGREHEARASAEAILAPVASKHVRLYEFRDGFLPDEWGAVKREFEALKAVTSPDLILTHRRDDLHQDHRVCCELTWNTFRDHLILEYEVPKYDGDLGAPNAFVALDRELRDRKIAHLMRHFPTQAAREWFQEELFAGLLRLRGMECNAPGTFAEAFYCHKVVLA
jgi:LmbE family N-acetylglucosaminyl deacetylase